MEDFSLSCLLYFIFCVWFTETVLHSSAPTINLSFLLCFVSEMLCVRRFFIVRVYYTRASPPAPPPDRLCAPPAASSSSDQPRTPPPSSSGCACDTRPRRPWLPPHAFARHLFLLQSAPCAAFLLLLLWPAPCAARRLPPLRMCRTKIGRENAVCIALVLLSFAL